MSKKSTSLLDIFLIIIILFTSFLLVSNSPNAKSLAKNLVYTEFETVGISMEPTIKDGETTRINKLLPKEAVRYSIVINEFEGQEGYFTKRVVGIPGDRLSFDNGNVYIRRNGKVFHDVYDNNKTIFPEQKYKEVIEIELLDDQYFVMGDNREASMDSRSLGLISSNDIIHVIK